MIQLLLPLIYIAFISLGLPDSLLGAAWPSMYIELAVPVSYAGALSMMIALGTVVSSLLSDRMTKWLGTGKVMAISVAMTAFALWGFSTCHSFYALCFWTIPYGLGAGSVDAALNNYVALHYESRHMSWLHCMWGVGTVIGPYILSFALYNQKGWNTGYLYISVFQVFLTFILFMSLPLWKKKEKDTMERMGITEEESRENRKPLSLKEIIGIRGAKEVFVTFFCYCGLEQTGMLWSASYFVLVCGISEVQAAGLAALFFIGITVGRAINGFLTMKFTDAFLVRLGEGIILLGIILVMLPFGIRTAFPGFLIIGLGCAPIYPCIIHSTPAYFGADKSQAIIGVQMASAYIGICAMPPLFGLIANHISAALLPVYLLVILAVMVVMHERLLRKTSRNGGIFIRCTVK